MGLVEALQEKPADSFFISHQKNGTDDIIKTKKRDSAFRSQVGQDESCFFQISL